MRRPRTASVHESAEYYERVENVRAKEGKLPEWTFDFISVHDAHGAYKLKAPLLLCDATGLRPDWEEARYPDKQSALQAAKEIARNAANKIKKSIWINLCLET